MYSDKRIDEKLIEYLSESRISLTELMVKNIPDSTSVRLDSIVSLLFMLYFYPDGKSLNWV